MGCKYRNGKISKGIFSRSKTFVIGLCSKVWREEGESWNLSNIPCFSIDRNKKSL